MDKMSIGTGARTGIFCQWTVVIQSAMTRTESPCLRSRYGCATAMFLAFISIDEVLMIDIQVRAESGEILSRGSLGLDWVATIQHVDGTAFPFLWSLLPYADTMFNPRQSERLRRELADKSIRKLLGQGLVTEIERFCLQVENEMHLYLWFVGD
ncbi:hypothetical protein ACN3XK_03655 [Actinomadura welshii]